MELSTEFAKDHIQESVAGRFIGARPADEGNNGDVLETSLEMTTSAASNTKFKTFVMAGAAAGIMEHCVMYPVDCVKVMFRLFWFFYD